MNTATFLCDFTGPAHDFPHFWEHTVGSCHAALALRADWQAQIKQCRDELGFKYVRFHGLLDDDMSTVVCKDNEYIYSFFNIDQVFDFLLSIGMRPFVELSFMPATLASGSDTVFHYRANVTPPKDINAWNKLIGALVTHLIARYGAGEVKEWFFEVWNEPNLNTFWKGTQAGYFDLYKNAAQTIKQIDARLQVGGPATANNEWITEFLDYAERNNVPVDFISTHHYPTDALGKPGGDTIQQLSRSERSILKKNVIVTKLKARGKPVYYTEWSSSSNPFDALHDQPYAAAFIIKTVIEAQGYVTGYSYWTFSDIFEENYFSSTPFHGGFGLMNIQAIPKPAYRAFELLHHVGVCQLTVTGAHQTLDVWVFRQQQAYSIMLTNWALPLHDIHKEQVKIILQNTGRVENVYVTCIDDHHANACQLWEEMGKPENLSPKQVVYLKRSSGLIKKSLNFRQEKGTLFLEMEILPQAVACITFEMYE